MIVLVNLLYMAFVTCCSEGAWLCSGEALTSFGPGKLRLHSRVTELCSIVGQDGGGWRACAGKGPGAAWRTDLNSGGVRPRSEHAQSRRSGSARCGGCSGRGGGGGQCSWAGGRPGGGGVHEDVNRGRRLCGGRKGGELAVRYGVS